MLKILKALVIVPLYLLASCGGGSGGDEEVVFDDANYQRLSGTWSGQSVQGEIFCSDGSVLSEGFGTNAGTVQFTLSGADSFEEEGTLELDGCIYLGRRYNVSDITYYSDDSACLDSVGLFGIDGDNTIGFSITPGTPSGDGICTASLTGEVSN